MRKVTLAILSLLIIGSAAAFAEDKPKLTKDDFDLVRKIDRIAEDVVDLQKKVDELNRKVDQVIANQKGVQPQVQPKAEPIRRGPPEKAQPVPTAPRPAGDGWQWDPVNNYWFRYVPYTQPFQFVPRGNCPNGQCPLK